MILGALYRTSPQSSVIVGAFDKYLHISLAYRIKFVIVSNQIVSQNARMHSAKRFEC